MAMCRKRCLYLGHLLAPRTAASVEILASAGAQADLLHLTTATAVAHDYYCLIVLVIAVAVVVAPVACVFRPYPWSPATMGFRHLTPTRDSALLSFQRLVRS